LVVLTGLVEREVLAVARGVLGDMNLEAVLGRVLRSARELTGARYAALGVLDESRTALERFITIGIDDQTRSQIGAPPVGRGVLGALISHPVALRVNDLGAHPQSYGFPAGHPPMTSFLGVPVMAGDKPYGNLYLTDKDDAAEFTADDEKAVVLLAEFAGVAIDHAHRYTASESSREDLQQTVAALDASIQIARALGGQTDLDAILQLVAKRGRALVSARALIIEQRRDGELVVAAGAGELPPGLLGQRVHPQDSLASTALRTARTQRLEVEPNRVRFERHDLGQFGVHAAAGLVVPLVFRGQTHGVLIAVDRLDDGPAFTTTDQRLLEAFATSAALAVATAQSAQTERRSQRLAATEQERGRWARELHDDTLQGLAALRFGLAATLRTGNPQSALAAIRTAVDQLDGDIAGLRSLITDLRPAALNEFGPGAAIKALADRVRRMGLDVDVSVDFAHEQGREPTRLAPDLETAVYRLTQEALTNARKHGNARRAVVQIIEETTTVHVMVRDDGDGYDPSARTAGFGLLGMHERAQLLGGALDIATRPGHGTTVTATLPSQRQTPRQTITAQHDIGQAANG
jgi:signal transduction histidine kinase